MAGGKKRGPCCVVLNCNKRKKVKEDDNEITRSDSDGSEDEDSQAKRVQPRTFHTLVDFFLNKGILYV